MIPLRASLIISTWNGRHLLETCLPRVIRAVARAGGEHEIIVVDDASRDDTVEFVRREFPQVKLLALERNLRFAGANNAAAASATGDVLLFLNNDMLVEPDFLPPLLQPFADPEVFAVTAHLQMEPRWTGQGLIRETGLVRGRFAHGAFVLQHDDPASDDPLPAIYAGGGSSAWRRGRFLELGGFDRMFCPFYFEDLDVSYRAQKRGWKLLFAPRSRMEHKHQQTNSPANFPPGYVELMFAKNNLLFMWKVLTDRDFLRAHFVSLWRRLMHRRAHPRLARGFLTAAKQLPQLLAHRHRARVGVVLTDREVFVRAAPGLPRAEARGRVSDSPLPCGEVTPPPGRGLAGGVADVLARAFLCRRAVDRWGLEATEPPHKALVIRAGSLELTQELVHQVRARFPATQLAVLAPRALADETRQAVGAPLLEAPGSGARGYRVTGELIRDLRARHFDSVFVAGERNRRAELIAVLASSGRRVEVRDDGATHVFSVALYKPIAILGGALLWALESVGLTALVGVVWGSIAVEGLVWRVQQAMGKR